MNFLSPELLLLSWRIAVLVAIASLLAFLIGWLLNGRRGALALVTLRGQIEQKDDVVHHSTDDLTHAKALTEELRRNLAATENQCVEALEQRDAAERQAVSRSNEVRRLAAELEELKAKETVPLEEHQRLVDELALLKEAASSPPEPAGVPADTSALEEAQRQLAAAQQAREDVEHEFGETKKELESLHRELKGLQASSAASAAEIDSLKHRISSAEALTIVREGQLEQLAKEKAEAEIALKARINELEARVPVAVVPVQLPKPPLPPPEVLAAPVDETFESFPPAPEATLRRLSGESLFEEAAMASFSPEVPSLEDAQGTLEGLRQELLEKEQLIDLLTAEHARRKDDLTVARELPAEEHEKLHAAEKAEHAAETRLAAALSDRDRGRRQVRALERSLALAAGHQDRADDLTRIKGIKGGISQQLHAFGIFTYRQIVAWDDEDMLAFSELLAFKNRLHRDRWQEQARALMEAKYGKGGS